MIVCSFCAKGADEVKRIIAGPVVFICDECIKICVQICAEANAGKLPPNVITPTIPQKETSA